MLKRVIVTVVAVLAAVAGAGFFDDCHRWF